MLGKFNTPSVDHLREGIDYRVLDWDFASPVPHTPGEPCPPGHKMVFGMCRRLKEGSQDWNPNEDSDSERAGKIRAKEVGSSFQNNKPVDIGGKKYGWAKKDGKDVLVEWGSVCAKKVNGVCVSSSGATTPVTTPSPSPKNPPKGQMKPDNQPVVPPPTQPATQKTQTPKQINPGSSVTWA